jgi:acylphosphatase
MSAIKARRFLVSGRVQGVGYRYFAKRSADAAGVTGWARNLDDGRVEVHANGTVERLDDFEARLWQGPRFSDVRSVETSEVAVLELSGFHIR